MGTRDFALIYPSYEVVKLTYLSWEFAIQKTEVINGQLHTYLILDEEYKIICSINQHTRLVSAESGLLTKGDRFTLFLLIIPIFDGI